MKIRFLPELLPALCLLWPALATHAQQALTHSTSNQTGRVAGVVKDPVGAVVAKATVAITSQSQHVHELVESDADGHFSFDRLPQGCYRIKVTSKGFAIAILDDLHVPAGVETAANFTLRVAPEKTSVEVHAPEVETAFATRRAVSSADQASSRNAAELAAESPGVGLRENGQLASVPLLHGLGEERAKLEVDGMTVSSSCPNHMNPPLSYLAPAAAAQITVMAGITPVSLGGDSLGGTISIESPAPVFAAADEGLHLEGKAIGFYRSNGRNYGASLFESLAGRNLGIGYTGSWASSDDYTDGSGHKVTSTYAQSTDHIAALAARGAGNLVVLEASLHHTPYEGFANAQMDLVRNYAEMLNLRYRKNFQKSVLDSHIFWQNTWHAMNIGKDKSTFPMAMSMPMKTHGKDLGYSVNFESPLTARHSLRLGSEWHRFVLDDRWPPVIGTAPRMGPDPFVSINDGRRTRLGSFAEIASRWQRQWTTLFGLRNDTVWSNTGPVQGYSAMMYGVDAAAFNAVNRARTDPDFDLTALLRYEPNSAGAYELGYARKTRAPNLYERYAWSTNLMASGMIGWFGDGNDYVGNVALKPEVANTVSATAAWSDPAGTAWKIKLTPYETSIQDYVDVDTLKPVQFGLSSFAQLQFANHNARIFGIDYSGSGTVWRNDRFGHGKISAIGAYLHGERLDSQTPLYQMMPLLARIDCDEELKGFSARVSALAVKRKSRLDPRRLEQATPGYALFNLHAGYRGGHWQAAAAADNLFNRNYEVPLGGVNFDDFMASGWMSRIKPLTGRGRSAWLSLTAHF